MTNEPTSGRRSVAAALAFVVLILNPWRACAGDRLPFLLGADVSEAPEIERAGVVFKDGGKPTDIFAIFRAHGANCIRLRLFVNPDGQRGVVNDLPKTIALARRVKAAGLLFSLDFHYSDTWADPGRQTTPAVWRGLALAELAGQVRIYTAQCVEAFREAGVTPDVVQIGNEITGGMLWPTGALGDKSVPEDERFEHLAILLKAGIDGVRDGMAGADLPKIMIHIDKAQEKGRSQWFFEHLARHGVGFDLIGLSYYPAYPGSFDDVRATLQYLAHTFRQPIAIVETAYPFADAPSLKKDPRANLKWPLTPDGQRDYLKALIQVVRETPDGLGAGVLYWYPESVPVDSPAVDRWQGGNDAMFDHEGNALPAFEAFR